VAQHLFEDVARVIVIFGDQDPDAGEVLAQ
jgi:hypothetical protein